MAFLLYRLGQFSARRAWAIIASWVLVLILGGGALAVGGGQLSTTFTAPDTESQRLADRLADELPDASKGSGQILFHTEDGTAFTADQKTAIGGAIEAAAASSGVSAVANPFTNDANVEAQLATLADSREQVDAGRQSLVQGQAALNAARTQAVAAGVPAGVTAELDQQQAALDQSAQQLADSGIELTNGERLARLVGDTRSVSKDQTAAVANVTFNGTNQQVTVEEKTALMDSVKDVAIPGVSADFSKTISPQGEILGPAEIIGVAAAAVVLLIMLGTAIAASLPIITALVGVAIGTLLTLVASSVIDIQISTLVLGLMLGLAVGIDYSLFILNRHRKQLLQGMEVRESIGMATGTSGNAVVFAGITVVIALMAMNLTGIPFLGIMGTAAAGFVIIAVLLSITMTPALLSLAGHKVITTRARKKAAAKTRTVTTSGAAAVDQKSPSRTRSVLSIVAGILALGIIAVPALSMRLGLPDASSEAPESTQYAAYTTIGEKFGEGTNGPVLVVADLPAGISAAEANDLQLTIAEQILKRDHVVNVLPAGATEDLTTAIFSVTPENGPSTESTEDLVHDLRDFSATVETDYNTSIGVTGTTAANIDFSEVLAGSLTLYLTVVLVLSLILLTIVFRSILVPLIASAGFLLSLFAALGATVAVYQWGWLGPVFAVHGTSPVMSFLPIILIGVLFGLAMDYQLFLVTGMREAYVHGSSAQEAVTQGMRNGRAVVTAAAIIMLAVFAGFIYSHVTIIKPIGFSLAAGVLLDAFVVRMFLVPAAMRLLGDKAWWIPKWLDRILPNADVEGESLQKLRSHNPSAESSFERVNV